jgi:branched-chain amino acid transport system permease protein
MTFVVQEIVIGLTLGAIYALIALGYTMVYGIIELINFAHGDIFMVGSLVAVVLLDVQGVRGALGGWELVGVMLLTGVGAMAFCGALGLVVERVAYRPLRNAPRVASAIATIGISLVLEDLAKARFGNGTVSVPAVFPTITYTIFGVTVRALDLLVIALALALMGILIVLVRRTRLGRAMRAVAQDAEAAALMGVNTSRIIALTFFIGAALAGAAGFVFGLEEQQTIFSIGLQSGLIAFTAAVLGGIGNIAGAMLGGMLIGLLQSLIPIFNNLFPGLQLDRWTNALVFGILIVLLVFRPAGILGRVTPEKA